MRLWGILIVAGMVLAGCATSQKVAQKNDEELCRNALIGGLVGNVSASRDEILKRGLATRGELENLEQGPPLVGLSECGALAVTHRYGRGPYMSLDPPYIFGRDGWLIFTSYDPRIKPAEYTNYFAQRGRELMGGPPVTMVRQLYVPKYLVALQGGKVVSCYGVDIRYVGPGQPFEAITTRPMSEMTNATGYEQLFPYPCDRVVPGFEKLE